MKDSPAIILAAGLAGVLGAFFPTAEGWVLEQSVMVMDFEVSAQSLGLFTVSKILFLPSLVMAVVGARRRNSRSRVRAMGVCHDLGWVRDRDSLPTRTFLNVKDV